MMMAAAVQGNGSVYNGLGAGPSRSSNGSVPSHLGSATMAGPAGPQPGGPLQPIKGEIKTENLDVKEETREADDQPEVDIVINNVVCSFSVRCHLNLKEIAMNGSNVEYRRENGMVTMKLRQPYTTASIWSSGKITCTGANSEDQARIAARKFSRILQKMDEKYKNIRIKNWRVVNVLGTCTMPFAIKITPFSQAFKEASYEPELHPGVTYKIKYPKATLKIFSTGSVTVTAPSVANVQAAIEHIYPLVNEYKKPKTVLDIKNGKALQKSGLVTGSLKRKGPSNGGGPRKMGFYGGGESEDADDISDEG